MRHSNTLLFAICFLTTFGLSSVAFAHAGHVHPSGWSAGLLHPLSGADHLLAIVASGLMAWRTNDKRAFFAIPSTFVALMIGGGLLATTGITLPFVELGILASVVVLGAVVALMPSVSVVPAAILVSVFAVFHGYAHVSESTGSLLTYTLGFSLMTFLLHAAAIGASHAVRSQRFVRVVGGTIACSIAFFLV